MNNFTPRAQQVLALARKEAERLGSENVEPEHLLLGIFLLQKSNAMRMLENLNFDSEGVRTHVEKVASTQTSDSVHAGSTDSSAYRDSLRLAQIEAMRMGHGFVGSEHLLLGVLHQETGTTTQIFREYGVSLEALRNSLLELFDPGGAARMSEVEKRIYLHGVHEQWRAEHTRIKARNEPALRKLTRNIMRYLQMQMSKETA